MVLAMVMVLGLITVGVEAESESAHVSITPDYALSNVKNAPQTDGSVSESEYGAPIIVADRTTNTDTVKFIQGSGYTETDDSNVTKQKAKIYMVADKDNLYVAATLDYAKENKTAAKNQSYLCPQFSVTLAGCDPETGKVPTTTDKETYRVFRMMYATDTKTSGKVFSAGVLSAVYKAVSTENWSIPAEVHSSTFFGNFANGTYTYEMRIPWDTVPGMNNGEYEEGKPFAMTIRLNDAVKSGTTACYYQIGGGYAYGTIGAAKPHNEYGAMIVSRGELCYQNSELAKMPDKTPNVTDP